MTSFDFAYYRPETPEAAAECYHRLRAGGKTPRYYGGGTELISMARAESLHFDAVIDLKGIPPCGVLATEGGDLVLGSAVTLTAIAQSDVFPLLGAAVARIADHTIQGKITLGGNLGGTIPYREAALPLLITDCRARVMGRAGLRELPFSHIFNGTLRLEEGDFLVQLLISEGDLALPHCHVKRTKMEKIDYPLVSLCANLRDGAIRAAVSGIGAAPVLLPAEALNDGARSQEERIETILAALGDIFIEDIHGGKAYRRFVLGKVLTQMYQNFGEALT